MELAACATLKRCREHNATGFQVGDFCAAPFEVRGKDGLDLCEQWRDGAEAYLGPEQK